VILLRDVRISFHGVDRIPYSEFQSLLESDAVAEVIVRGDTLEGSFKEPRDGKARFTTQKVDADLATDLRKHGITFSSQPESVTWGST
jgi:cell division protease FtsH